MCVNASARVCVSQPLITGLNNLSYSHLLSFFCFFSPLSLSLALSNSPLLVSTHFQRIYISIFLYIVIFPIINIYITTIVRESIHLYVSSVIHIWRLNGLQATFQVHMVWKEENEDLEKQLLREIHRQHKV